MEFTADELCLKNPSTADPMNWGATAKSMAGNWGATAKSMAGSHFYEVNRMVEEFRAPLAQLEGAALTIPQVAAVAAAQSSVKMELSEATRGRVRASSEWVMESMNKGTDSNGVTTGLGATSHWRTEQGRALQKELIRFLNAGIFGSGKEAAANTLPGSAARAAMLVRVKILRLEFVY